MGLAAAVATRAASACGQSHLQWAARVKEALNPRRDCGEEEEEGEEAGEEEEAGVVPAGEGAGKRDGSTRGSRRARKRGRSRARRRDQQAGGEVKAGGERRSRDSIKLVKSEGAGG